MTKGAPELTLKPTLETILVSAGAFQSLWRQACPGVISANAANIAVSAIALRMIVVCLLGQDYG